MAEDDVAISVEGLSKIYLIGHEAARGERYQTLRDSIARGLHGFGRMAFDMARGRQIVPGDTVEEFWALKDVSFKVARGEVIGIIGRNGAGKSTLLKILSRITEPTQGRVRIRGRVASLLEVGTGFHPELTGRENIFLNGAVLGMTRAEIRRKFDEIVAFAEVEKFLDTPVKRYSSGMYVRLAFAVAAHLEPEILIVDEVLAVGDAEFQKKCLGKMGEVAAGGRTVLFVSHQLHSIAALCRTAYRFETGRLVASGAASAIVADYLAGNQFGSPVAGTLLGPNLRLEEFSSCDGPSRVTGSRRLRLRFYIGRATTIRCMQILVYNDTGLRVGIMDLRHIGLIDHGVDVGEFSVQIDVNCVPLTPGRYRLGLYLFDSDHMGDYLNLSTLIVDSDAGSLGFVASPPQYRGFVEFGFSGSVQAVIAA